MTHPDVLAPPSVPAPRTAADNLAQHAAAARWVHERLTFELERHVIAVRAAGGSWADVGQALGITRQSAHERYRHVLDRWHGVDIRRTVDGDVSAWVVGEGIDEPVRDLGDAALALRQANEARWAEINR